MKPGIAIDAMGGDLAPREIVRGAVLAARSMPDASLYLVGKKEAVEAELAAAGWDGDGGGGGNIVVVDARQVIEMADSPVDAFRRKRGSSIEESVRLVQQGKASAFVSAGNTGACVAISTLLLRLLPSVKKAGIAVAFYAGTRPVVVIDVGANVECRPEHLLQYGVMARLYARDVLGVDSPRVGLLNIGEEDAKGNRLAKVTHSLFQNAGVNFIGNIEGIEIFRGACEVVVCDGFTGNIVLKVSEGLAERLVHLFKDVLAQALLEIASPAQLEGDRAGAAEPEHRAGLAQERFSSLLERSLTHLQGKLDYAEFGGAPLLGVNGNVIIAHGRSDAKAVFNAIRVARRMSDVNINDRITSELDAFYARGGAGALSVEGGDRAEDGAGDERKGAVP